MSDFTWNNGSGGTFDVAGNWVPDTAYPVEGDTASFSIPATFTISGDGTASAITVSDDVTYTGSIEVTGPTPPVYTAFEVTGGGAATFDGGSLTALSEVMVGNSGGDGLLAFINGATGTLTATNSATALDVAFALGTSGTVAVDSDSLLTVLGGAYVGVYGAGTLAISNATVQVLAAAASYNDFEIGVSAGADGTVTVGSGGSLSVGEFTVIGDGASGLISFTDGATGSFSGQYYDSNASTYASSFAIYLGGYGASGTLSADGAGTSLSTDQGILVGQFGAGLLSLTNGADLAINPLAIDDAFAYSDVASFAGSTGTVDVSGGAQISGTGALYVGAGGYGSIDLTSGALVTSDAATGTAAAGLGQLVGGVGVGTIDDATWDSEQSFFVGYSGIGSLLVQDGGTLEVDNGNLRVARDAGGTGTLTFDDSQLDAQDATLTLGPDEVQAGDGTGGSGTVEIQDTSYGLIGNVLVAGLAGGTGRLDITGSSVLSVENGLSTGAGTSLITTEDGGAVYDFGTAVIGGGGGAATVSVTDGGGFYDYDTGITVASLGTLAIDASANLDSDPIMLDAGTVFALGDASPANAIEIIGGAASDPSALGGSAGSDLVLSQGVTFASGITAALLLDPAFDVGNVLHGFAAGDTLDVRINGEVYNTASYDVSTEQLVLSTVADAPLVLNLADNGYSATSFSAFADGSGGTDVVLGPPPCYVAGTRILTARGEIAVEALAIGDQVVTASGGSRPIVWLGHRAVDCARHPEPDLVWPIRVLAGAFGAERPGRDLWLSPGHNVAVDGVLMPISALQNGRTVMQVRRPAVVYWHVELDAHDIMLAEGLPAESYLDTGNRADFVNGADFVQQNPDFRPRHWANTCLPLVFGGPEVQSARAALLAHAASLGHTLTGEAGLHVMADGKRFDPIPLNDTRVAFLLPDAFETIVLRSRRFIPAHVDPATDDGRWLGVCVGRLQLDGEEIALDDDTVFGAGWHAYETHPEHVQHRWTHGSATLPAHTRLIIIDFAGPGFYWTEAKDKVVALFG